MSKPGAQKSAPCLNCGAILTWTGNRGRPRKYCDYKCRDVVYGKRATRERTRRVGPPSRSELNEINRKRMRDMRQQQNAALHQAKLDRGACADCGMVITDRTAIVIEWDHPDKTDKTFTIAYEKGRKPLDVILAEVAKCDAVCANCHRYRTHDRQDWKHDTTEVDPDPTLFD